MWGVRDGMWMVIDGTRAEMLGGLADCSVNVVDAAHISLAVLNPDLHYALRLLEVQA
jgi:hypothetical protein